METDEYEAMYQLAINDYIVVKKGFNKQMNLVNHPEYARIVVPPNKWYTTKEEVYKDFVKEKGFFITETKLGKGLTPKVIPKAIQAYFLEGKPIKEFIENHTEIKDFLMSEKTGKQWTVEYNNVIQQRTNRFYASTDGAYLWKWKDSPEGKSYQNMLASSGVTILNTLDKKPISERKINYRYYLREALKIVDTLEPKQLSLFADF